MTTLNRARSSYRQIAAQTAPPGQLVLMLFDGALRFLEQARQAFQNEDPLEFNLGVSNNIMRAQAIIQELNLSLNMEAGGEFSGTMRRLYDYFDDRLQESNCTKTDEGVREVIDRIGVIRQAWAQMLQQPPAATVPVRDRALAGVY